MRQVYGGAIQSQNTPLYKNTGAIRDYAMYRCMVYNVRYVDGENLTGGTQNPRVLYDVVVLGGDASGRIITNCRLSSDLGENDNYDEVVLKATTKKLHIDPLESHDGAVVFVIFNQGFPAFPVIIRCDQGLNTEGNVGAEKADGQRRLRQFNGVKEVIDSDGVLTITTAAGIAIRITDTTLFLGDVDAVDFVANATKVNTELLRVQADLNVILGAIRLGFAAIPAGSGDAGVAAIAALDAALTSAVVPSTPSPVDVALVTAA